MVNHKINTHKIIRVLDSFDLARCTDKIVYKKLFSRLLSMGFPDNLNISSKIKPKKRRVFTLQSFFKNLIKTIQLLNKFEKQRKIIKQPKDLSPLVLGVASNRINFSGRDFLVSIENSLTCLDGSKMNPVQDIFKSKKTFYVFDPITFSDLWKNNDNSKVLIFDMAFLFYLFVINGLSSIYKLGKKNYIYIFLNLLYKYSQNDSTYVIKREKVFVRSVFLTAIKIVSEPLRKVDSILMTSNSNIIEILRADLISNINVISVIELLHGILMHPSVEYFKTLYNIEKEGIKATKQKFVFQVDNLPNNQVLPSDLILKGQGSINPYIRFNLQNLINKKHYIEEQISELEIAVKCKPGENKQIITFFGTTNHEGDFYNSSSFKFEIKLIQLLKKYILLNSYKTDIFYVPHPSNVKFSQDGLSELEEINIKLINKSILAYLISDKCISLISSCLFEMKWFGGTSFTPMIPSDQMFDKHYLSTIHHPKKDGEKELVNSFEKFINQEVVQIPLMKKINQRINKVIN